ncbi:acyltransferase family protein [Luteococcus sp. OSA5]|uniref:acyltransferase family protein n=1 Tax=Luteococcus sp. OSA5 TaxID=3401630 RepID=UPI003B429AB9
MRAIAVGSVLLFHAHVPGLEGGFVGVDVFYVLSGFLITGVLLREVERSGRIGFLDFYARRLKRLAPVYLLVLLFTVVAMAVALPPLYIAQYGPHVVGALLYVANFVLASDIAGYFADGDPSPVLHFWSLAVEEQFYLLWPLVILLATRGASGNVRARVAKVLLPVVIVSFLLAVTLTPRFPTPSFYLLHTRAWELGIGALLACFPLLGHRFGPALRTGLLAAGGLAVLGSALAVDSDTTFPGWATLPCVLGTAVMLIAGNHGTVRLSKLLLENRVMVWLGDISYSLYLWHWPILVLPAAAHGGALRLQHHLALAALSVLAAWATHVWIERPFQQMPLAGRRKAIYLTSLGATLALTLVTLCATGWANHRMEGRSGSVRIEALEQRLSQVPAAVLERYANESVTATGQVVTPLTLTPALADLKQDLTTIQTNGCADNTKAASTASCWGGDPSAKRVLVLFGDSHASHWWPAWDAIGRQEGYRVLGLTANACPINDLGERPTNRTPKQHRSCQDFRDAAFRTLDELQPEVIVASQTVTEYRVFSPDPQGFVDRWRTAMPQALAKLPKKSTVLFLGDSPSFDPAHSQTPAPGKCLSEGDAQAGECLIPARMPDVAAVEKLNSAFVQDLGGRYANLSAPLCTADGCPMVTRNNVLYRDHSHVTSAAARIMTPILADELSRAGR